MNNGRVLVLENRSASITIGGNTLVMKQQTERKSANHQVKTPSVKSDCVETNLPFDPNSVLPVRIDHPSICTSGTALPSDECFEPLPASEKEPTTDAIQVGDGDEENGFVTAASTTKEPTLAAEIFMDGDCLDKTQDGGGLPTVVLRDKGKGVDPREYGGALYDLKSMIAPSGTTSTSTGGSDSIELVGIHQDKGKNVDPKERGNGMAKYCEPGPRWSDFHESDHNRLLLLAQLFPEQVSHLQFCERKRTTDFNDGPPYNPTLPQPSWHPKISPYRFMVFSIPLAIGTVKAVLSQKGSVTTPITLEWITGVMIFLV
jgi:hypothetical protein